MVSNLALHEIENWQGRESHRREFGSTAIPSGAVCVQVRVGKGTKLANSEMPVWPPRFVVFEGKSSRGVRLRGFWYGSCSTAKMVQTCHVPEKVWDGQRRVRWGPGGIEIYERLGINYHV